RIDSQATAADAPKTQIEPIGRVGMPLVARRGHADDLKLCFATDADALHQLHGFIVLEQRGVLREHLVSVSALDARPLGESAILLAQDDAEDLVTTSPPGPPRTGRADRLLPMGHRRHADLAIAPDAKRPHVPGARAVEVLATRFECHGLS